MSFREKAPRKQTRLERHFEWICQSQFFGMVNIRIILCNKKIAVFERIGGQIRTEGTKGDRGDG